VKPHTKIYLDHFGFDSSDFIPCEICGREANDIHHIDCKGMGGDPKKTKDKIENLMAVCRKDHEFYGDKKQYVEYLKTIHLQYISNYKDKYEKVGR